MKQEDDDLIPWADDLPPRIEEGEYDAVVLWAKKVNRFGLTGVEFQFRIVTQGPAFDARLPGFCNLGPAKHARISPHSKMARWMRVISSFTGGSPSRVTLRSFRGFWFTVQVRTVTETYCDRRRELLAERDQYSSVKHIVGVVGKLGELPSDRQPPSQYPNEDHS